jgi:hypothetical protein
VRELAMRTIGLAPLIKQRDDRFALVGEQAMHGVASSRAVLKEARFAALPPAPRAALGELEVAARAAVLPARSGRLIGELKKPGLGGRVDAARNPATQSQRPFPSASMSRTPISFSASDSRAISALASASAGRRRPS